MKKIIFLCSSIVALMLLTMQCKLDNSLNQASTQPTLPTDLADYATFTAPQGDPNNPVIDFPNCFECGFGNPFAFNQQNPQITNAGATLGRVLFYDTKLSINNAVACASCHKQNLAFSDEGAASTGFGGKTTPRNSMAIVNVGFNNNLFWDSRSPSVMDLASKPIQNHIEMGMESMEQLSRKLQQVNYYPDLFEKAFGSRTVSADRISSAMAQFVCAMVSSNSKWDQGAATGHENFTTLEKAGKDLFFGTVAKCSQCHAGPNFSAPDFVGGPYGGRDDTGLEVKGTANIGLDVNYKDNGLGNGKFRIPSLRNVALTAPYMHDGRFATLEEVVEHYNSKIQPHAQLDAKLKGLDGQPQKLNLNAFEKEALVAFLNTLTDQSLTTDKKFENPFSK